MRASTMATTVSLAKRDSPGNRRSPVSQSIWRETVQKQHLRRRVGYAPSLARIWHGAEVVQQAASVRLVGEHVHLGLPIRRENPSQAHNRYLLIAVNLTSLP